jgi:hypothetical protein
MNHIEHHDDLHIERFADRGASSTSGRDDDWRHWTDEQAMALVGMQSLPQHQSQCRSERFRGEEKAKVRGVWRHEQGCTMNSTEYICNRGTHLGNTLAPGNEARIAPLEEAMLRAPVEKKKWSWEWMKWMYHESFSFAMFTERWTLSFRHHRLTKIDYVWSGSWKETKEMTVKRRWIHNTTIRDARIVLIQNQSTYRSTGRALFVTIA